MLRRILRLRRAALRAAFLIAADRSLTADRQIEMGVAGLQVVSGRDQRGIAIERNLEIVPKSEHASTVIEAGDRIELVQFVGGG